MQSADAVTPDPTYGTAASSSRPCTVPSSPNGPWRIGRTTSTGPSGVGALVRGTGSVSPGPPPASGSAPAVPSESARCPAAGSSQRPSRPMPIVVTS